MELEAERCKDSDRIARAEVAAGMISGGDSSRTTYARIESVAAKWA